MPLLVTSAAGANGDGYGALLAFDLSGRLLGGFSEDARIAAQRGLAVDWDAPLLFLNSGENRVLALDPHGKVVRDTCRCRPYTHFYTDAAARMPPWWAQTHLELFASKVIPAFR